MKTSVKSWIWFLLIMALILGAGIYLGNNRRRELGRSFDYSLEEYRQVDPALLHYREISPVPLSVENPSALAIGDDDTMYVAGKNGIVAYPSERRITINGTPLCLSVDADGVLYAGFTNRIEIIPVEADRSIIEVPAEKSYLTSLAVQDRMVYAADAGSRKIWRFSLDEGEPFEIGHEDGEGGHGFYIPSPFFDIDLADDGSIWAVNPGYHALEQYGADGRLLTSWESSAMTIEGFSGCCNPAHFSLLPDGGFVTSEKGLPRVKVHNPDGSLRCVVAAPDQFKESEKGMDIVVDTAGRVYVLDTVRRQVRIFEEIL